MPLLFRILLVKKNWIHFVLIFHIKSQCNAFRSLEYKTKYEYCSKALYKFTSFMHFKLIKLK